MDEQKRACVLFYLRCPFTSLDACYFYSQIHIQEMNDRLDTVGHKITLNKMNIEGEILNLYATNLDIQLRQKNEEIRNKVGCALYVILMFLIKTATVAAVVGKSIINLNIVKHQNIVNNETSFL